MGWIIVNVCMEYSKWIWSMLIRASDCFECVPFILSIIIRFSTPSLSFGFWMNRCDVWFRWFLIIFTKWRQGGGGFGGWNLDRWYSGEWQHWSQTRAPDVWEPSSAQPLRNARRFFQKDSFEMSVNIHLFNEIIPQIENNYTTTVCTPTIWLMILPGQQYLQPESTYLIRACTFKANWMKAEAERKENQRRNSFPRSTASSQNCHSTRCRFASFDVAKSPKDRRKNQNENEIIFRFSFERRNRRSIQV